MLTANMLQCLGFRINSFLTCLLLYALIKNILGLYEYFPLKLVHRFPGSYTDLKLISIHQDHYSKLFHTLIVSGTDQEHFSLPPGDYLQQLLHISLASYTT